MRLQFFLTDGEDVPEHREPYNDMVPPDPTVEQMLAVVVTREVRPSIQDNWRQHPVSKALH